MRATASVWSTHITSVTVALEMGMARLGKNKNKTWEAARWLGQVEVLATKPDVLGSIPGNHITGEKQL